MGKDAALRLIKDGHIVYGAARRVEHMKELEQAEDDFAQQALTPRQARMLREEMDRKRREEEEKLFSASSGVTVEKDW